MRRCLFLFLLPVLLFSAPQLSAQIIKDPTTWSFETKKKDSDLYDLIFKVKLKKDWHLYSFNPGGDGLLLPPEFRFEKTKGVKLIGKTKEKGDQKMISENIEGVGIVHYFENGVTYTQTVKVAEDATIKGEYFYQVCDHEKCLNPVTKPFSFKIKTETTALDTPEKTEALITPSEQIVTDTGAEIQDSNLAISDTQKSETAVASANDFTENDGEKKEQQKSLLKLFFLALVGGILAVLTPCVYSMIPITVSFFTKRSKTRAEGIRNAGWYSLSIILIFTILGVLISLIFGANALNNLSTNWIANLFFFAIFVIFGISFLGAFEITLPSSWTSKTDSRAGLSSFGGIFFMALTLVIVSFSCTGPIIGPLLVLAGQGGIAGPVLGMFGFSIGLAMPFALFAIFPGMLNKMATSGGWLNQIKVVLGFLEMMLALKFLSNADLAMGWRLLDREVFIAIWIVLAVLLGLYLLGKIKLSHDDATPKNVYGQEFISLTRLFLAMAAFTFAIYLVPGMWGAPLNGMSQFLPPMGTQDFVMSKGGGGAGGENGIRSGLAPKKYVADMKIYEPPVVVQSGLVTYYDYEEALAAAKELDKPLMLDFTGINCVNCRKMEAQVWSQPEVMKRLKEDFVIASLYCDMDKIKLPESEQFFSKELGSKVVTLGDWNEHLQASKFNSNTQPFYFFVDQDGKQLSDKGYSYDPNTAKFVVHLDKVKAAYKAK